MQNNAIRPEPRISHAWVDTGLHQAKLVTLFCFPYSGAPAVIYRAWNNHIPAVEIIPVDFPGHGSRLCEPLYQAIEPLVETVARILLPQLHTPFAFFGHSMGALVGFELARHLSSRYGLEPVHLFVSGHNAPHLQDSDPPIHNLPDDAFVQKILAMNGTEDCLFDNPELRDLFLPILRADFTICETYRYLPGTHLRCPITALGGIGDTSVPRASLEAWQMHSTAGFKLHMFPGDHFFLNKNPPSLMEVIARALLNGHR